MEVKYILSSILRTPSKSSISVTKKNTNKRNFGLGFSILKEKSSSGLVKSDQLAQQAHFYIFIADLN